MAFDLKTRFAAIGTLVVTTIAGIWITDSYGWLLDQFKSAPAIKIDFQATGGCSGGNLIDLKRHFDNQSVALEEGADRLIICSQNSLLTNSVNAPGDIAHMFPGCLDYRTDSLRLMRGSSAVCALSKRNIFICDGQVGTKSLGVAGLGNPSVDVAECATSTVARFGFE
ncbi:UNVERIFIED_ORG: hypothetical protein GGD47_002835 [Rhizobium etli]